MTLEECFDLLHGDYKTAVARLINETMATKFVRKFLEDPTMQMLRKAVAANNRKEAFSAAHTLKGVAANLSFTELQQAASMLTEQLRDGSSDPDAALVAQVEAAYSRVIAAIQHLD